MSLLEIFCDLDDFCKTMVSAQPQPALPTEKPRRNRKRGLSPAEIMTLLVWFHRSGYRTFKDFYTLHVCVFLKAEFPGLVSYNRFGESIPSVLQALCQYLSARMGTPTGLAFVDSTPVRVCHNRRITAHKVFAGLAKRGKTSTGWFFGFKVHLTINEAGELLSVRITAGNVDDRVPLPNLTRALLGNLFGDKGYLSKALTAKILERGLHLVTKIKKNMPNILMPLADKLMLWRRGLIESVIDRLKNGCQIEHSRHRSVTNGFTHLIAGLAAYCTLPQKPSLRSLLPGIVAA